MPPENKDIFVISNVGLNAELDKIDNDVKKTSFEDALKLIGMYRNPRTMNSLSVLTILGGQKRFACFYWKTKNLLKYSGLLIELGRKISLNRSYIFSKPTEYFYHQQYFRNLDVTIDTYHRNIYSTLHSFFFIKTITKSTG